MYDLFTEFLTLPFWPGLFAGCALKSFVILSLAGMATWLMRHTSAAWRHLVWFMAMGSLWAMPALTILLPAWTVPLLQNAPHQASIQRSLEAPFPPQATADKEPPFAPVQQEMQSKEPAPGTLEPGPVTQTATAPMESTSIGYRVNFITVFLFLWAMGLLISLLPIMSGLIVLRRIARDSTPASGKSWESCLSKAMQTLGLRRKVRCFQSGLCCVPIAFGILRPMVVLPLEAESWPDAKKELVLLHELGHIQRRDWFAQIIARLAACLYWFNPLVWLALGRMRVERELACDDLVLNAGTTPSEYARELLDIAHSIRWSRPLAAAAITMARPGHLEGRVRAILDAGRKRGRLTKRLMLAVAVITCLTAGWLGALKPTIAAKDETPPVVVKPLEYRPDNPQPQPSLKALYRTARGVSGDVRDAESGAPIEEFWTSVGEVIQPTGVVDWKPPVLQHNGSFHLYLVPEKIGPPFAPPARNPQGIPLIDRQYPPGEFKIRLAAKGFAWSESEPFSGEGSDAATEFALKKRVPQKGTLIGVDGAPAMGTTIRLSWMEGQSPQGLIKTSAETDGQGQFDYPEVFSLLIVQASTEEGFHGSYEDPANPAATLQLQRWGRVEGIIKKGDLPVPQAKLELTMEGTAGFDLSKNAFRERWTTLTDGTGFYRFGKIPPGIGTLTWVTQAGIRQERWQRISRSTTVKVHAGPVTQVHMGGKGRSVVGRVGTIKGFPDPLAFPASSRISLTSQKSLSPGQRPFSRWGSTYAFSQEMQFWTSRAANPSNFGAQTVVEADGSFRFEDIPPVTCELHLTFAQNPCPEHPDLNSAAGNAHLIVPRVSPEADSDLGVLDLNPVDEERLEAGSEWPGIDQESTQGTFAPSQEDGKFILIHFWAPWHKGSVEELVVMKRIHAEFGGNPRFRMAGICLGTSLEDLNSLCEQHGLPWEQIPLRDWWDDNLMMEHGIQRLPSAFLISPDWEVLAADGYGEAVYEAVKKAFNP